jgi:hypothetical protein
VLPELVENIIKSYIMAASIGKLFVDDSTYDSNDIYRNLVNNGILSYIRLRNNTKVRMKAVNLLRHLSILAQKNDLQKWKKIIVIYEKDGLL